jgi:transcriptional regulator with XRE-family HTH domain
MVVNRTELKDVVRGNLRRIRVDQGMTQAELAEKAGIKRTHLCRFETGVTQPLVGQLGPLAAALGVHPSEFLK